jgi:hypothetical protein
MLTVRIAKSLNHNSQCSILDMNQAPKNVLYGYLCGITFATSKNWHRGQWNVQNNKERIMKYFFPVKYVLHLQMCDI